MDIDKGNDRPIGREEYSEGSNGSASFPLSPSAAPSAGARPPIFRMTMSQQHNQQQSDQPSQPMHPERVTQYQGPIGMYPADQHMTMGGNAPSSNIVMQASRPAPAGEAGTPATAIGALPQVSQYTQQQQFQSQIGRSMPVSPTYGTMSAENYRSPPGGTSISGPPTPHPSQLHPNLHQSQHQPHQQPQQFYQSPPNTSLSPTSTTSFLANQHQQNNPQSIGTTVAQAQGQQPPQVQQLNHRMALNDAFSYLDRVKSEFSHQPEVYNKFLQVMREFKANVIDANGVIVRVVYLFRGHRDLILGFNAFLPRTHHIDPIVAETGELPPGFVSPPTQAAAYHSIAPVQRGNWPPGSFPGQPPLGRPPIHQQQMSGNIPQPIQQPVQPSQMPPSMPPQPPQHSPAPLPQQQPVGPGPALRKSTNAQFAKAISYVKKVKQRFANDPECYKTFLGALHSVHKDQRSVSDVYGQMRKLFRDHQDLLDEFIQFLPESSGNEIPGQQISRLPPMGQFSPAQPEPKPVDIIPMQQQPLPQPTLQQQLKRSKRSSHHPPPPPTPPSKVHHQPAITKTAEEVDFFEKVKKHLGNRVVYAEFLKCLNMYSQNILKLSELIQLVSGFIGGSEELFSWFKRYIGYNPSLSRDEEGRGLDGSDGHHALFAQGPHDIPEINLNSCRRIGSYRLLPSSFKMPSSSGRTELCKEVLNDEMISCPTFESEDSTFISSKKNAFEEALFRCEDERFELDLLIDGNRATIAVLEPILKSIQLNQDMQITLDNRLNGTSAMIYKRAIKRVYADKGGEVYDSLQKNPLVSLPVVLKRLKQKDEEWQRARRDWQRVWREVHTRNFYRSLDHQGIDFKQTDRRSSSVKMLLHDLDVLFEESRRAGADLQNPLLTVDLPPPDSSVYTDAFKLLLTALKHSGSISYADRGPVRSILQRIIPCAFDSAWPNKVPTNQPDSDSEYSSDNDEDLDNLETGLAAAAGERNFYLNGSLYGIVRMFETVVERLYKMRALSLATNNTPYSKEKQNVIARFLDLCIDDGDTLIDTDTTDMYRTLVKLLKQLLSGDIETSLFEEQARFMFGLEAYLVFTLDRLLHSILRQAHSMLPTVTESRSSEQLIKLLEDSARLPEYTIRISAEALISPNSKDRLIKVHKSGNRLQIFLVDSNQLLALSGTPEERWSAYVDSFIRLDVNPLYVDNYGHRVFLKRSLRKTSNIQPTVMYNLECKICVTYKLFYVENTEDFVFRETTGKENSKRGLRFQHWLGQFRWQD